MKKVICFIFVLFIGLKAEAKTYYSDYSEYSDFNDCYAIKNDLVDVETKDLYHAYIEEKNIVYLESQEGILTGNKKEEYTPWTLDINEIDVNKKYETKTNYYYNKVNDKYDYLFIINPTDNYYYLEYIYSYIKDTPIMYTTKNTITKNNKMTVPLGIGKIQDLKVDMHIEKRNSTNLTLYFYISEDNVFNENEDILVKKIVDDTEEKVLILDDLNFLDVNELFLEKESVSTSNNFNGRLIKKETSYRNHLIYYEQEITNRKYLDLYLEASEDYKLDLNDKKTLYRFRTRNKVIIEDEIIIDKKDINLKDYITFSSIPKEKIKITSNIDLNLNGTYKVNYILPFKTVVKDAIVDLKENYINLINKQNDYIKYLKDEADKSVYKVDKKNQEIKEIIISSSKEKNEINEKYISCQIELKNLKDVKENFKVETKKETNNFWDLVIIILTIFFIMTIIVEIIRKKKSSSFVEHE